VSDAIHQPGDIDDELQTLIDAYCEHALSTADQQRLEARLAADPVALERFVLFLEFHSRMRRWALRAQQAKVASDVFGAVGSMGPLTARANAIPLLSIDLGDTKEFGWGRSSVGANLRVLFGGAFSVLTTPLALLLVAAGFLLGGATAIWWIGHRAADIPSQVAIDMPRVAPVAYLTMANGCDWGKNSARVQVVGSTVNLGEELTLLEGIAEFRLSSGASLSIEGPATLVMTSPDSLVLQQGTLTTRIPWKASDFQILAGTSRLTALDAEFGVQVKGSSVNVHVFSGEVRAEMSPYSVEKRAAIPNEELAADEYRKPLPITIKRSEAVAFTSNSRGTTSVRRFSADQDQFASRTPMAGPLLITSRYVESVKRSKPIAYWRFEAVKNHEIPNEISTRCALKVTTELNLRGDETNRVLESGYAPDQENLVSTETMGAFFQDDFSVELWIKPSHFHWGVLVSLMDRSYPPGEVHFDQLTPAEIDKLRPDCGYGFRLETCPDFGSKPGTLQGTIFDPLTRTRMVGCFTEKNLYRLRRWQHVVLVRGNGGMQFYLDGKKVASAQSGVKQTFDERQHLAVGRLHLLQDEDGLPFIGQLDELAIYKRALDPQEIMEHFQAVTDQSSEANRSIPAPDLKPPTKAAVRREST
jgi:hypothetical protein